MKNIREYPCWDNEFFGAWRRADDFGEKAFIVAMSALAGGFGGMMTFGVIIDFALLNGDGWGIIPGVFLGIILMNLMTRMSKFYKGWGLPASSRYDYGGTQYNFVMRAEEYFSLSKEDRRLYPNNIINVMRDPDLTKKQRHIIDNQMRDVYASIQERDKQKRLLAKRDVDIDAVLEYMAHAKESVDIEAKTYAEYR